MPRILIAEDSATQAEKLAAVLEGAGYTVTVAADAVAAFDAFLEISFDAVVSDIVMPGLPGYDLCRQIKAHPRGTNVPVILLSTLNEPMDIIRGLECGADNFLTKPYSADMLLARVASIIENRKARAGRDPALGIDIVFLGERFAIHSAKEQVLDLLISTFEDSVRSNLELQRNRAELAKAKAGLLNYATTLEERVSERTRDLAAANEKIEAEIAVRKQTEAELVKARTFLDLIIENIPATIIVKNAADLKFILVNSAAEQELGLPRDQMIGKRDADLMSAETAAEFAARDDESLRTRSLVVVHEQVMHREGQATKYIRIRRVPVLDDQGEPRYLINVAENVTMMRQLEERLRQSQKLEAVGQLTGGIAHDFNNILGLVIGNLDQLIEVCGAQVKAKALVTKALDAALRGAEVIRRLMAFSRNQPLAPKLLDVVKVVREMEPLLRQSTGERNVIEMRVAEDVWPVLADRTQLENAILNLSINARDAMPDGGRLTIDCANVSLDETAAEMIELGAGDYVKLTISDTGTGMPADVMARVFEPFFTTKEVGKGTGLGLSMVYGYAKQSGGSVKIYSEVGRGTDIRVYLPRERSTALQAVEVSQAPNPVGSERILVVEDQSDLREMAADLLNSLGYRTTTADNAASAIEIFDRDGSFDLLFTDLIMPGPMGGIGLAQEVRRRCPHLPIVFTTGFSDPTELRREMAALGASMVGKPYRKSTLAACIRAALQASEQAA